jgi:hypothetical protein
MASAPVIAVGKPILKTYRKYAAYKERFDDWRAIRPFWGGALLMFAGALLAYIPFYTLDNFAFTGGTAELIGLIGLVFAFFVFLSGVAAITHPQISTLAGMTGIIMSILSIVGGTFGGMGVGTFVGMVGGSLCVAWIQEEETVELEADSEDQDMEELRKKAQQYEQMVSEGEIDADDDVEISDLSVGEDEESAEATESESVEDLTGDETAESEAAEPETVEDLSAESEVGTGQQTEGETEEAELDAATREAKGETGGEDEEMVKDTPEETDSGAEEDKKDE